MIWYSFAESFGAIVSALIYGGIFSIFCILSKSILLLFRLIFKAGASVLFYKGSPFSVPKIDIKAEEDKTESLRGEFFAAVKVILYSMGLTVLLYYTLDGAFRAFAVLASLISLLLVSRFLSPKLLKVLLAIFKSLLWLSVPIIRLVFYPLRALFRIIYSKCGEKCRFMRIFTGNSANLSIDSDKI